MGARYGLLGRAFREPLVQFAVPAALVFGLNAAVIEGDEDAIHVTPEVVAKLAEDRALVLGRPVTAAERAELVEDFVAEEVLLREAVARGLDRRDGKVREHLVNKMMFLLDEEPPEPTVEELRTFYAENHGLYTTVASISLEHAFFEEPPPDPGAVLAALRAEAPLEEVGDPFYLGQRIGYITPLELAVVLGEDFVGALEEVEVGRWRGPFESARGVHFVRITARHDARRLSEADVAYRIRDDWLRAWVDGMRGRRIAELRRNYRVVVEGGAE